MKTICCEVPCRAVSVVAESEIIHHSALITRVHSGHLYIYFDPWISYSALIASLCRQFALRFPRAPTYLSISAIDIHVYISSNKPKYFIMPFVLGAKPSSFTGPNNSRPMRRLLSQNVIPSLRKTGDCDMLNTGENRCMCHILLSRKSSPGDSFNDLVCKLSC